MSLIEIESTQHTKSIPNLTFQKKKSDKCIATIWMIYLELIELMLQTKLCCSIDWLVSLYLVE